VVSIRSDYSYFNVRYRLLRYLENLDESLLLTRVLLVSNHKEDRK